MTRLSDTQLVVLSAAATREGGDVLPMPANMRGAAAGKVVKALLSRGLIAEALIGTPRFSDTSRQRIWRMDDRGRVFRLRITDAGLEAIGVEPVRTGKADAVKMLGALLAQSQTDVDEAQAPVLGERGVGAAAPSEATRPDVLALPGPAPKCHVPRPGTKQAVLIEMLSRPEGATIPEIVSELRWQAHTARGAISGALKKRLGLNVISEKIEGRGTVHRIVSPPVEG